MLHTKWKKLKRVACCHMTTHENCMKSFLRKQMQAFNFNYDSICPFCQDFFYFLY